MATTKICSKCKRELSLDHFFSRKISKDGLRGNCKKCEKEYNNSWYSEGRWRDYKLRITYGITEEELLDLLKAQNYKCAICEKILSYPNKNTHVDHDHTSGKVRGVLCHTCNTGLGKLGDSIESLTRALNYLKENTDGNN